MTSEEKSSGVPHSELVRMRGEIVTGLAVIESGMCKCISTYFFDPKLEETKWLEFHFGFLYHDNLHFNVKKDFFEWICKKKKIKKFPFPELLQLQKIRNKFAHSWAVHFDDGSQDLILFKEMGNKDAKELYEEYKSLAMKVKNALFDVMKKEERLDKI